MEQIINQKQLFRLAALIYSTASDNFNENDTLLSMIEGIMLNSDNEPMKIVTIAANSITQYCFIMTEDEIRSCILQNDDIFLRNEIDGDKHYCLYNKYYKQLLDKSERSIEYFINEYTTQKAVENVDLFKDAIYKFLYELTTSNIFSYQKMFNIKAFTSELLDNQLSVDSSLFSEEERTNISNFLSWESDDKNYALTNLIFCCLEYCLFVSGDRVNDLATKYIQERSVFLDTNIIYRALGINGKHRQEVIRAFLKKCNQANIKLYITSYTRREFIDSMRYHVDIAKQYPVRNIYDGAFEEISDYSVYTYFYSWKNKHLDMNDRYFWTTLEASLDSLFEEFSISNSIQNFNIYSKEIIQKISEYDGSIKRIKIATDKGKDYNYIEEYSQNTANQHDAILIYTAEQKSQEMRELGYRTDCLVVSSDKTLRHWDMNRRLGQPPLVVYPSQLFSIIIKVCGRSIEDIKSFVSFINIKPTTRQISATQANVILSGISTVTEDVNTQKSLISTFIRTSFQTIGLNTNNQSLFDQSRALAENYLEQELKTKADQLSEVSLEVRQLRDKVLSIEKSHKQELSSLLLERDIEGKKSVLSLEKVEKQKLLLAESIVKWKYWRIWKIYPFICVLYLLFAIMFFISEIFNNSALGGFSNSIVTWYKNTLFGTFADPLFVLNSVIATIMIAAIGYAYRHCDKAKRHSAKQEMIDTYLKMYTDQMSVK